MTAALKDGKYRRAAAVDAEYGHTCPFCSSPKDRQALRCARCYHDSTITSGRSFPLGRSNLPAVKGRREGR